MEVSWLDGVGNFDFHAAAHSLSGVSNPAAKIQALETWFAEEFARLLGLLDAIPAGDGSLLDNSLVLWMKPMSKGGHQDWNNLPLVVAGGAGGRVSGNRYLNARGAPHHRFLVSIAHAMGLDDIEQFGDPRFGSGPLAGLVS